MWYSYGQTLLYPPRALLGYRSTQQFQSLQLLQFLQISKTVVGHAVAHEPKCSKRSNAANML
jgi:hypothetical protein